METIDDILIFEGMGQSEMEFMDLEDQEILREEMLTLLGLSHAPKTKNVHEIEKNSHTVSEHDDTGIDGHYHFFLFESRYLTS